jgi:hypothetical protein
VHALPAKVTDVSSDDPGDFGVVTGVAGAAGCGHTVVVVVVTAGAVVEVFTTVVGGSVVTPSDVLTLGLDVDVVLDALPPLLLLQAARTNTARQTQAE